MWNKFKVSFFENWTEHGKKLMRGKGFPEKGIVKHMVVVKENSKQRLIVALTTSPIENNYLKAIKISEKPILKDLENDNRHQYLSAQCMLETKDNPITELKEKNPNLFNEDSNLNIEITFSKKSQSEYILISDYDNNISYHIGLEGQLSVNEFMEGLVELDKENLLSNSWE